MGCRARSFNADPLVAGPQSGVEECDVIVAGGSLAALSTAVFAAKEGASVCLLEPTDWVGGQMTAEGVSAVDFPHHIVNGQEMGKAARAAENLETTFRTAVQNIGNPGACWVSSNCFQPRLFLNAMQPVIRNVAAKNRTQPGLRIFPNTVVKQVSTTGRTITAVEAISRTACTNEEAARRGLRVPYCTGDTTGYDRWLSRDIPDWYSRENSSRFLKTVRTFRGRGGREPIVVEATEFGDVLALSGASYLQGVESALDSLTATPGGEVCGMATVFPFVMEYADQPVTEAPNPYPDYRGNYSLQTYSGTTPWERVWTYRRLQSGIRDTRKAAPGDLSMQNWNPGNDYLEGYLFKNRAETAAEVADWKGGLNLKSVADAEMHAIGWHHWLKSEIGKTDPQAAARIRLSRSVFGTGHGLSKLPYLRDIRRSIGVGDFAMKLEDISCYPPAELQSLYAMSETARIARVKEDAANNVCRQTGTVFPDAVGIGSYVIDIRMVNGCARPAYLTGLPSNTAPYFLPFRALTNRDFDNLLVAGKTMAQTFVVNAATRLHPVEWHSGVAAGVSAALMVRSRWKTQDAMANVSQIQSAVRAHQPIGWTLGGSYIGP